LNAALAFALRGSFLHGLLVVSLTVAAVVAGASAAAIRLLGPARPAPRRCVTVLAFGASLSISCAVSMPFGSWFNRLDIRAARAFCDKLQPSLERTRRESGRYPDRLLQNPDGGQLPRLLREDRFSESFGDHYRFSFDDPSSFIGQVQFDSRDETWTGGPG